MIWRHAPGECGVQEWLSFYLKAPQAAGDVPAEQDLFIQQTKLKNTLREWMGEPAVNPLRGGLTNPGPSGPRSR